MTSDALRSALAIRAYQFTVASDMSNERNCRALDTRVASLADDETFAHEVRA